MSNIPRSKEFDDVYFSVEDGLAETTHVFLDGNDLEEKWRNNKYDTNRFYIYETGFGTGLNFLAAWKLFEETSPPDQHLSFISVEKFPLSAQEISDYLQPWADKFDGRLEILVEQYPSETKSEKIIQLNDRITLQLYFEDVSSALPKCDQSIDAWFLDGFKPSSNPDMWSETLFEHMARLSKSSTSFATFTAAGFVRRGLQDVGFDVQKVPGFGRKREMLIGEFNG